MKQLTIGIGICCTLATSLTFAQTNEDIREEMFDEYLKEKIRNPEIRDYIYTLKEYREATEAGLQVEQPLTVHEFLRTLELENQVSEDRDEYTFQGGAEPYIEHNPATPMNMIVSYMSSSTAFDYPIYYTNDGGDTWTQSPFNTADELTVNQFPGDAILGGGDPVMAYSDDGIVHLTWIYVHGQGFNVKGGMFYASSSDGGATWDVPSNQSDHVIHDGDILAQDMLDRQWMAVDNSGGPYDGRLYMSAIYFGGTLGPAGEVVMHKDAAASGFNLTPTVAVPLTGGDAAQFGNVKVDDNGMVHMACMRFNGSSGSGDYVYVQSIDGGASFTTPMTVGSGTTALPNGGNHPIHDRDNSACSMAVDGGNVYIAWSDFGAPVVNSYYVHSNDGGSTFSTPVEFGDVIFGAGYYHLMPNVCADDGNMTVCWYKIDTSNYDTEYMAAFSVNGGMNISGYAGLSGANTDFSNEGSGFYGDYNASLMVGCNTYAAWCDGRTGNPVVYFGKINACVTGMAELTPVTDKIKVHGIYPNPVEDQLTIEVELEEAGLLTFELLDINGKHVQQRTTLTGVAGTNTWQTSMVGLATGSYLLRLTTEEGVFVTRQIVKK